ncbi:MAG: N-acetylmuramoyl-L-alanine amidase, partial [Solobacterium sp.]|nr:N-acetylmuramoyl-L-alanine amidase [Solobacterium sp.]
DATNTYIEQKEHYTIVIDPAYGGELTGYVGALTEAEVNYAMAEAIMKRFEEDKRFTIVLTRANGESKAEKEKATKINEDKPDLCISLYTAHERSGKGSGMQIYPKKIGDPLNEESLALANHVQKAFQKDNWQPNVFYRQYVPVENNLFQIQNIKVEEAKELTQSTWNILEDTTVNTIAVEQFYLSNEADIAMWANEAGYKEIADRYYQAICNYFQMK